MGPLSSDELTYSPYAYEIHEDPYPTYARLRDEAPLYRNDELDFWALSRHADVVAAFRDRAPRLQAHVVPRPRPAPPRPHARPRLQGVHAPAGGRHGAAHQGADAGPPRAGARAGELRLRGRLRPQAAHGRDLGDDRRA